MSTRETESVGNRDSVFDPVILLCLVATLSYVAARLSEAMVLRPQMDWALWPGNVLLVSMLLFLRRRIWPLVIAAAFAAFVLYDLQEGLPLRSIGLFILSDTVEVLTAVLCLGYVFEGMPELNSVNALAKYSFFAVILAPLAGAFVGAFATKGNYWTSWRIGFFSEALGFLILVPAILGWIGKFPAWAQKPRAYYLEASILLVLLVLFGYSTFFAIGRSIPPALLYSFVPLLLWSALRFELVGVGTSVIILGSLSIWGTIHGRGPFIDLGPLDDVLSLQLFLFFAAAPFMVLAVLVEERRATEEALRNSEVRERTKAKELETVLDAVPVPVLIASDVTCQRIAANRAGCELLHLPVGANFSKSAPPDEQPPFRILKDGVEIPAKQLPLQRAAATGQAVSGVDELVVFEDGTKRNFISNAAPLLGEDGTPYGAVAAVLDVTERQQTEETLRENRAQLAAIISSAMDAIITVDVKQRIQSFNEAAEIMFACSAEDAIGQPVERFIPKRFRAQHGEHIRRFSESGVSGRAMGALGELAALRANGEEFPIEASISATQVAGKKLFTVILRDITERNRAEKAVRESEERFRLVANTAPVLIWMSGLDKMCNYFNQTWLDFTGRSLDAELGNGWAEGVHSEDLQSCLDTYTQAFDRQKRFSIEYRLRRNDGEYRWILDIGVPRFNADRSFAGHIGSCVDITERKQAEEVLTSVNRRLIEAQERERTRIARELHDDIGQRLALLAIALEQTQRNPPDSASENLARMGELGRQTSEIATDIQTLSHELHSSKLEYLGIVPTMRSFCSEFGKQQKVEVEFESHDLAHSVPPDVSLCLFRVLQEALHNAAKHSGARQFKVQLRGTSSEIHLTVSDSGRGFNPEDAVRGQGLGLISMKERLHLVKGEISIDSQPKRGTTIHARVPLISGG